MFKRGSVFVLGAVVLLAAAALVTSGPITPPGPGAPPPVPPAANPGVLPPGSTPYGKTYGEWSAAWSVWVTGTTPENCPVLDTTGEFALVDQSRPVYFLAGTFGTLTGSPWETPLTVTRNVTIPAGVALFVPVSTWGLFYPDDLPTIGAPKDTPLDEALVLFYDALNGAFDSTPENTMACDVDGVAVKNLRSYRGQSEPFLMQTFDGNVQSALMDWFYPDWAPFYAAGTYTVVADGYYVMLAPLPAGRHTIHIRGGTADAPWFEVYYNLTVQGGRR